VFHVKQADEPEEAPRPLPEVALSAAAEARLDAFLALLLKWNARINLVRDADPAAIRGRHVADSIQLLPLLPDGEGPVADLGSGGGFPGLVLAAVTDRPFHLVESDRRKAAFLTEAAARLDLAHVRVHAIRIEQASLPPVAALTARALASLTDLLPHAARLLAPEGIAIFPKGRSAETEITEARHAWTFGLERFRSRTDPSATILRLSHIRRGASHA
jgi:16S rRNA (guanine527-N7)-methyltransferase